MKIGVLEEIGYRDKEGKKVVLASCLKTVNIPDELFFVALLEILKEKNEKEKGK